MRLYRSPDLAGLLVGEDEAGSLVQWPAIERGWSQRTPYTGPRRALEEIDRGEARGTGWPGGPRGRRPRAGAAAERKLSIRGTEDEHALWSDAAGELPTADWARRELTAAAKRKLGRAGR